MTTRIALLGRDDAVRAQLRAALVAAGADLVHEGNLIGADPAAVRASAAQTLIVNLEPGAEDAVDALDSLIGEDGIDVVFNEAEASSQLSGWDLARWARHLVAKVLGDGDATPPPPPGAELLPQRSFVPKPGAPPRPEREVGDADFDRFVSEATDHPVALPESTVPDVLRQAEPFVPTPSTAVDSDHGDPLAMAEVELPKVARSAPIDVALETAAATDASDAFQIDLGEVESALQALGGSPPASDPAKPATPAVVETRAAEPEFGLDLDFDFSSIDVGTPSTVAVAADAIADAQDEMAIDLGDIEASLGALEAAGGALPSLEDDLTLDNSSGLDLDFDLAVDGHRPLPSLDDAAELDLGADAELAALAAQMEAGSSTASRSSDAGLDFAIEVDFQSPAEAESPPMALPAAATQNGESEPKTASGFGSLSLAGFEDEAAPAPVAKPEKKSFDFGGLSLSLEPLEDAAGAGPASAVAAGIPRLIALGASIGGPDALRTFLSAIPAEFPALFVLAQHLENGFFGRLAEQLQKSSKLKIRVADDGAGPAAAGQVLVVPSSARFSVARDGAISQFEHSVAPHYKPCIDDMFRAAADVFGKDVTAIIFSGMAGDAVEGASYVTNKGGEVWVQDPASCVVSSMVDGARSRGVVEFTGSPRDLAERCVARYGRG